MSDREEEINTTPIASHPVYGVTGKRIGTHYHYTREEAFEYITVRGFRWSESYLKKRKDEAKGEME